MGKIFEFIKNSAKSRLVAIGSKIFGFHLVSYVLRLISTLLISRILYPEAFGLLAIIVSVNGFLALVSDMGLSQAVVSGKRGSEAQFLNSAWTLQVLRGSVLAICVLIISLALYIMGRMEIFTRDSTFANSTLPVLLAISAFSSFLLGFKSIYLVKLARELNFSLEIVVTLASQVVSLVATLVMAILFKSAFALVIGLVIGDLCTVLFGHVMAKGHKHKITLSFEDWRELLLFGRWIFLSTLISGLIISSDRILIGALYDSKLLGFYAMAATLIWLVENATARTVGTVYFSALSQRVRDGGKQSSFEFVLKSRILYSAISSVVSGLLFMFAPIVCKILYDDRYTAVGLILQILSFRLFLNRIELAKHEYIALDSPRWLYIISIIYLVNYCISLSIGYIYSGYMGIICALALHHLLMLPVLYILDNKLKIRSMTPDVVGVFAWIVGALVGFLITEYVFGQNFAIPVSIL